MDGSRSLSALTRLSFADGSRPLVSHHGQPATPTGSFGSSVIAILVRHIDSPVYAIKLCWDGNPLSNDAGVKGAGIDNCAYSDRSPQNDVPLPRRNPVYGVVDEGRNPNHADDGADAGRNPNHDDGGAAPEPVVVAATLDLGGVAAVAGQRLNCYSDSSD